MTLEGDIADYVIEKMRIDKAYAELKETEAEILYALKQEFPVEWKQWEQGRSAFSAYGVTLELKRSYDIDKVKSLLGEEHPELFTTETKVTEKLDGKAMMKFWKDAAMARKLADTLVPPAPEVEGGEMTDTEHCTICGWPVESHQPFVRKLADDGNGDLAWSTKHANHADCKPTASPEDIPTRGEAAEMIQDLLLRRAAEPDATDN